MEQQEKTEVVASPASEEKIVLDEPEEGEEEEDYESQVPDPYLCMRLPNSILPVRRVVSDVGVAGRSIREAGAAATPHA